MGILGIFTSVLLRVWEKNNFFLMLDFWLKTNMTDLNFGMKLGEGLGLGRQYSSNL